MHRDRDKSMEKNGSMWRGKKVELGKSPRMLLIALNGIGNLLLATPFLTNGKKMYPRSAVSVLALGDAVSVLKESPYVDEVIIYPEKSSFLVRIGFLLSLRKRKFDVSFYPYPNVNAMSAIIAFIIGAKVRVNFEYRMLGRWAGLFDTISIPVDLSKHDIGKNLDLLEPFHAKVLSRELFIPITKEDKNVVDGLLKGKIRKGNILIGMHVGSKESMRIWPTGNFAKLAQLLSVHKNIKILLVGTSIEEGLIKGLQEFNGRNIISLLSKATIPETTEAIRRCALFVTTDSGPMHMAVAAKTKVIAVYLGPNIRRTAPYGKKHVVFLTNKATMAEDGNKKHLYVDKVTPEMLYERIKKELGKRLK